MLHKAWSSIEEVPYCFLKVIRQILRTPVKKMSILTRIRYFQTVTPVWMHQWLWNDAKNLKWHRRGALLFFGVIHQVSRSHGLKNRWFEGNLSKITRPVAAIKSLRFALLDYSKIIWYYPHLISLLMSNYNQGFLWMLLLIHIWLQNHHWNRT